MDRQSKGDSMGISMSAIMVTDDEIHNFIEHPERLEELLNRIIPRHGPDECYLLGSWRRLEPFLPQGTFSIGDVEYSEGLSDATHALYSSTTKTLATRISELSGYRMSDPETQGAYDRLGSFVLQAARQGKGLIFCQYEDW
jgi:hypothetical protein